MPDGQTMQEELESILAREVTGFRSLQACDQLTAGASQETFRIQADTSGGVLLLALRRSPPARRANLFRDR